MSDNSIRIKDMTFTEDELSKIKELADEFKDIASGIGYSLDADIFLSEQRDTVEISYRSTRRLNNILAPEYKCLFRYRKSIIGFDFLYMQMKADFFDEMKKLFDISLKHERIMDELDFKPGYKVWSEKLKKVLVIAHAHKHRDFVMCIDPKYEDGIRYSTELCNRADLSSITDI